MRYLDPSELLFIISVEDVPQVHFKVVHVGTDSAFGEIDNFQVDDMFVNLFIGNLFVAVKISEDFCNFGHFNGTQGFLKVCLFCWWVNPFESSLYFLDVGQTRFILVFGSQTLVQFSFDVLGLIIDEGQNGAESLLFLGIQESGLSNFFGLQWLNKLVTDFIKVGEFNSSGFFFVNLLQNLFELCFREKDSDTFEKGF